MYYKEGTVYKRKRNGRWEAKIMDDGYQRFLGSFRTQKEANECLKEAIAEKERDKKKKPEKALTLFQWLEHWHEVFRLPKLARGELSERQFLATCQL